MSDPVETRPHWLFRQLQRQPRCDWITLDSVDRFVTPQIRCDSLGRNKGRLVVHVDGAACSCVAKKAGQAALGRLQAAEAKLDQARADYKPTIALVGQGYQNIGALSVEGSRYFSVNEPSGNILLQLSWLLFDGGARDARIGIARFGRRRGT